MKRHEKGKLICLNKEKNNQEHKKATIFSRYALFILFRDKCKRTKRVYAAHRTQHLKYSSQT